MASPDLSERMSLITFGGVPISEFDGVRGVVFEKNALSIKLSREYGETWFVMKLLDETTMAMDGEVIERKQYVEKKHFDGLLALVWAEGLIGVSLDLHGNRLEPEAEMA